MGKYAIGVDFGTLSGRTVLVDIANGAELATSILDYPHGVMSDALPGGRTLGVDWALQHPQDYLDVLESTVPEALRSSGVKPEEIVGVGIDFTACTPLPVTEDGTPLCFLEEFEDEPHAYVKLWKHHAAQPYANRLNEIAAARGEPWLARYGGKISSEWLIPKIWQIFAEAPEIYARMAHFVECADWVVWMLTGAPSRNACLAGYKAMWSKREGYPPSDFFEALDPGLRDVTRQKLSIPIRTQGECVGGICPEMARRTGLNAGTPVATGNVDAHVSVAGVGITGPGKMLAIMGTSTCHMLMSEREHDVPGICGCVEDGILPGFFGYEAGQPCVGDHFAWLAHNAVPERYFAEAAQAGLDIHAYLQRLAEKLEPGESGLLALDWWNGNRSVLVDADLTGMMLGMTLQTKAEEMYRALVEATAYGTRMIIENFETHGVPIEQFIAAGGIADKSPWAMQVYADVIRKPIRISGSAHGTALSAAVFGAVAAGARRGGFDSIAEAAAAMGKLRDVEYSPDPARAAVYDALYAEFKALHDYFGRGVNDVMKRLKQMRIHALSSRER